MTSLIHSFAAVLAATVGLTACGGGGASHGSAPLPAVQQPGIVAPAQFSYGQSFMTSATYVGKASFGTLGLDVAVKMTNERGLQDYAVQASDPRSANYRHFLSPKEIADRFGASDADYKRTAEYFGKLGLHVSGWPQREILHVSGPQALLEKAFSTTFGIFERKGVQFVAPARTPALPPDVPVTGVGNLITVAKAQRS